jgi:hypothetical protein
MSRPPVATPKPANYGTRLPLAANFPGGVADGLPATQIPPKVLEQQRKYVFSGADAKNAPVQGSTGALKEAAIGKRALLGHLTYLDTRRLVRSVPIWLKAVTNWLADCR